LKAGVSPSKNACFQTERTLIDVLSPSISKTNPDSPSPGATMMTTLLPENEPARLKALHDYGILDTPPEQAYDDLAHLAAQICHTPIAMISLVDGDRQWYKAKVGTNLSGSPREHAFCAWAILEPSDVMVVADASNDQRFVQNPLVTGEPHIRAYAGAPLVAPTGEAVGTICVIDQTPREFSREESEALRALSRQVMAQFELRRSITVMEDMILEREHYIQQLEGHQRQMEKIRAQLEVQSMTDGLTGVQNRRAFQRQLHEEFRRARLDHTSLTLLMLDIDKFKNYNDHFGHLAGDAVLCTVAQLLHTNSREQDIVARYGGEEFAIILPGTSREGAVVLAERFRRMIQRAAWPHGTVTASLGVAILDEQMLTAEDLLDQADKALYQAKRQGRNRVSWVEPL
jgi:diguanylate cyclase (GGDEF)-like protein